MRYGLIVLAIAGSVAIWHGWLAAAYDRATTAALPEEARLAIQVRCEGQDDRVARKCRSMMKKLFLSRSLDPDRTLRTHCNSVKNARWGGSHPAPPELCVRRYGGWPRS